MQYKTAKAWNKTPSEWSLLSKKDKTTMMAFDKAEGLIESWHTEEMEKRMKIKGRQTDRQPRVKPKHKHIDKRRLP